MVDSGQIASTIMRNQKGNVAARKAYTSFRKGKMTSESCFNARGSCFRGGRSAIRGSIAADMLQMVAASIANLSVH